MEKMNEKEIRYEFRTILSESHPGLTFEEFRDTSIFLLFYHYLCLRYDDKLDEEYKLHMMVRLALRGKLQMDTFLKFMDRASAFLHLVCPAFTLTEFSFYKKLQEVETQEKQKSYARFIRKMIKKLDLLAQEEATLSLYPSCFEALMLEFSNMKKETGIPEAIMELYHIFGEEKHKENSCKVFQPEFRYGALLRKILSNCENAYYYGSEKSEDYLELMRILCFLYGIKEERTYFSLQKDWTKQKHLLGQMDMICVYKPEGVEAGSYLSAEEANLAVKTLLNVKAKGELPYLLSAFPLLKSDGMLLAIMPSSLLYREGRESQIRRYLVEELDCLDAIVLLPDAIFPSIGQQEVFLFMKKKRSHQDIMFFDCSRQDTFNEETLKDVHKAFRGRKNIAGFCSRVEKEEIKKNDFNLNLPRYIKKLVGLEAIDIDAKRKRIQEIDQELKEIDARIDMYRRDLELDALLK